MRYHIIYNLGIKYVGKFQLKTSFLTKVFLNKKYTNRLIDGLREEKLIFEKYFCQNFNRPTLRKSEQKMKLLFRDLFCRDQVFIIYRISKDY